MKCSWQLCINANFFSSVKFFDKFFFYAFDEDSRFLAETLSIIENAGLMGVPIPQVLIKAIDVLKAKEEK